MSFRIKCSATCGTKKWETRARPRIRTVQWGDTRGQGEDGKKCLMSSRCQTRAQLKKPQKTNSVWQALIWRKDTNWGEGSGAVPLVKGNNHKGLAWFKTKRVVIKRKWGMGRIGRQQWGAVGTTESFNATHVKKGGGGEQSRGDRPRDKGKKTSQTCALWRIKHGNGVEERTR